MDEIATVVGFALLEMYHYLVIGHEKTTMKVSTILAVHSQHFSSI